MSDIVADLIKIADASQAVRLDGYGRGEQTDIPLGEQCRKAATEISALRAKLAEAERENRELRTQDDPTFTYAFKVRAEAAESRATALAAEVEIYREALTKVSRSLDGLISSFRCSCTHPCDDYFVWPGPCGSRASETFRNIKVIADAALRDKT